jgi:hypothetical protein
MEKNEAGLDYLQVLISCYKDHEDKGVATLIAGILQGIERMKACA